MNDKELADARAARIDALANAIIDDAVADGKKRRRLTEECMEKIRRRYAVPPEGRTICKP